MPDETFQSYLNLAKQRHEQAIRSAEEAYWSYPTATDEEKRAINDGTQQIDTVTVDRQTVKPHPGWSLPDFNDELRHEIKVTQKQQSNGMPSVPLFSADDCQEVLEAAEEHFRTHHEQNGEWTTLSSGQYPVAGFWIKSIPAVHEWFNRMVRTRLFPLLAREFPDFVNNNNNNSSSFHDLVVDNAYLFKYTVDTGRRTDVHTDSGCLAFTIALGGNYSGGGTWVEGLGTVEMDAGHVTVRPGGLRHCGQAIEEGTRYIIGGFCMHRHRVEYARMLIGYGADRNTNNGDTDKLVQAKEALLAALLCNPHFDGAYTHLASVLQKLGQDDVAQQVLEHCLRHVNPSNGEVAYTLGVLYLKKKKKTNNNHKNDDDAVDTTTLLSLAKDCFQVCLQSDPYDVDAMMGMAQATQQQQQQSSSSSSSVVTESDQDERYWYERIVQAPGVSAKDACAAYCNLGVLYQNDKEAERLCFEKAVALVPTNYQSRFSLGSVYASAQEWDKAVEQYRHAIAIGSNGDTESLAKALRNLYHCAVVLVQQEGQNQGWAQEQVLTRLKEVMGTGNFEKLAAMQQQQ